MEAERQIRTQFKMERIVYCQDYLYCNDLRALKAEDTNINVTGNGKGLQFGSVSNQESSFVQEMISHTKAYFNVSLQTMIQEFFCTLNAIAYTPHPDLTAILLMQTCCKSSMQYYCYAGDSSQRV